jgi:rhamnulose-1-phosphate aldolase
MSTPSTLIQKTMHDMGVVGSMLHKMGAAEGAAGNISCGFKTAPDFSTVFPVQTMVDMPFSAPEMSGFGFLATGSGCRLRDVLDHPTENVGAWVVNPGGLSGTYFTAEGVSFTRLTSEFNTHMAFHRAKILETGVDINYIVHGHPPKTTFLSHIDRYQNEEYLNQHLLHWEPETLFHFPTGVGMAQFRTPGTMELTQETLRALTNHEFVIWARHGAVARSAKSFMHCFDMIEYIETAAQYEYFNLTVGEQSTGISSPEMVTFARIAGINQTVF